MKHIFVVHGHEVDNPGENEELSPEGKLRVITLLYALEELKIRGNDQLYVILSGGKVREEEGQINSEAKLMLSYLQGEQRDLYEALDIPSAHIHLESISLSSIQNIDYTIERIADLLDRTKKGSTVEMLRNENCQIHLVSSDYHLRRLVTTRKRRLKVNGYDQIEKEWINPASCPDPVLAPNRVYGNVEFETYGVYETLQHKLDQLPPDLQEHIKRCKNPEIKAKIIELVGRLLAVVGKEDLLEKFGANTPLIEVAKQLLLGKNN